MQKTRKQKFGLKWGMVLGVMVVLFNLIWIKQVKAECKNVSPYEGCTESQKLQFNIDTIEEQYKEKYVQKYEDKKKTIVEEFNTLITKHNQNRENDLKNIIDKQKKEEINDKYDAYIEEEQKKRDEFIEEINNEQKDALASDEAKQALKEIQTKKDEFAVAQANEAVDAFEKNNCNSHPCTDEELSKLSSEEQAEYKRLKAKQDIAKNCTTGQQTSEACKNALKDLNDAEANKFMLTTESVSQDQFYLDSISPYLDQANVVKEEGAPGLVIKILKYAIFSAGILAVLGISLGGFFMVLSRGDENFLTSGKNALFFSIVGLVVILLAYVMVSTVQSIVYGLAQ